MHWLLGPHCDALAQPQWPLESQIWLEPQGVPVAFGGLDGTLPVHKSLVQSLPSTGRSAESVTSITLPAPSHCRLLQSPGFWLASAWLAGT